MTRNLRSDEGVDQYVMSISRHPVLTREQEVELAEKYKETGCSRAADKLVVSNLRFVVKVAHEYRGYGFPLLDLVQEGNIGLMKAVEKFEPAKGYRLISYAVWWIRAYIQNYIMKSWSLVKMGTTQAQRKLFFKLRSEREKVESEMDGDGRASADDLAARLNVNVSDINDMEARLSARDFSLDCEIVTGGRQRHIDILPDHVESPEESFAEHEEKTVLLQHVDKLSPSLNEKEKYILGNRLLSEKPVTLQEIGTMFSISRERARQIEGNVIRKLRTELEQTDIAPDLRAL